MRKVRIEKGISQKDVANILKTSDRNVWRWENISRVPTPPLMSRIITFIGYIPNNKNILTYGEKLYWARQIEGLSQQGLAKKIGVSEQSILLIETHNKTPKLSIIKLKVNRFVKRNMNKVKYSLDESGLTNRTF